MRRHRFVLFLAAVFAAKLVVVLQLRGHPLRQSKAGLDTAVDAMSPLYIYFLAGVLSVAKPFAAVRVVGVVHVGGRALAMMGRHAQAIAQFGQGVAFDPADPAAQLNLAVAYAEAGRAADARARAQEALRLKPDYQRARQFLGWRR